MCLMHKSLSTTLFTPHQIALDEKLLAGELNNYNLQQS